MTKTHKNNHKKQPGKLGKKSKKRKNEKTKKRKNEKKKRKSKKTKKPNEKYPLKQDSISQPFAPKVDALTIKPPEHPFKNTFYGTSFVLQHILHHCQVRTIKINTNKHTDTHLLGNVKKSLHGSST